MVRIIEGDAAEVLPTMEAESVHCCVTSPPYWGLRDYGTAEWEGGDAECDHRHPGEQRQLPHGDGRTKDSYAAERISKPGVGALYSDRCGKCGARRIDRQLGLERTPEEYVEALVGIFREVRRVLREDGTAWLNLGDSYVSGKGRYSSCAQTISGKSRGEPGQGQRPDQKNHPYLKDKDLCGIPWRVAFALQADGWWLRQDIIWSKPNPMPESVRDRCTKAHEYIFLLSKAARYYYDQEAISEAATCNRMRGTHGYSQVPGGGDNSGLSHGKFASRNRRSVWTIATEPYPEAHFATFPKALVRPCILAGCPQGGTVLDPFAGTGTVGEVAEEEGRNSVLVELKAEYAELARRRTAQAGLFTGQERAP